MGTYTTAELGEMFSVSRATVYRTIRREPPPPNDALRPFAHPPTGTPQTASGDCGFLTTRAQPPSCGRPKSDSRRAQIGHTLSSTTVLRNAD